MRFEDFADDLRRLIVEDGRPAEEALRYVLSGRRPHVEAPKPKRSPKATEGEKPDAESGEGA